MGDFARKATKSKFRRLVDNVPKELQARTHELLDSLVFIQEPWLRDVQFLGVKSGDGSTLNQDGLALYEEGDKGYLVWRRKGTLYTQQFGKTTSSGTTTGHTHSEYALAGHTHGASGSSTLKGLSDVDLRSLAAYNVLVYNYSKKEWQNKSLDAFNRLLDHGKLIGLTDQDHPSSAIYTPQLGTPTYNSVEDFMNQGWSSGHLTGMELSDGGSNTVAVAAGTGIISDSDLEAGARQLLFFDFAGGTSAAIADGDTKWVGIEYNSGTPQIVLSASSDVDEHDHIALGWVTREGATLHITNAPTQAHNIPHQVSHTMREVHGFARADYLGGLILGETGTRNPTLTAGEVYYGLNEFDISAVDCSAADTFTRYYRVAGVWTSQTGLTQWPNTQYTDGTNLQTMTVNRYGCLWFYVDLEDGELIMLYGTSNAALQSTAEAEAPPSTVPPRVQYGCVLVGRIVFQASAASAAAIQSAFNVAFNASGTTDHNALSNLAVGDPHTQYLLLTAGSGRPLTGDLYIDKVNAPGILLREGGSATSYSQFQDFGASAYLIKVEPSNDAYLKLEPVPDDGTHGAYIEMFRLANTTGSKLFSIYGGSGSAVQHDFNGGTGDVDLCQQGGQVTIGGTGGTQTLTVVGGAIGLDNAWALRGKNNSGTYIDLLKVESGGFRAIIGASGSRTKLLANDSVLYPVPTSAVSDANHDNSYMTFWVDETGDTINFKVKYSGGTVKSGSVALA